MNETQCLDEHLLVSSTLKFDKKGLLRSIALLEVANEKLELSINFDMLSKKNSQLKQTVVSKLPSQKSCDHEVKQRTDDTEHSTKLTDDKKKNPENSDN